MAEHVNPLPFALAAITLVLAFCGVALGRFMVRRSADDARSDTRNFIRIVITLMTSMVGLLLSLQLSSAKAAFDAQERQVTEVSSEIIFLDTALAHSGRGSQSARTTLYDTVEEMYQHAWPDEVPGKRVQVPPGADALYEQIDAIAPANESQRFAKARALTAAIDAGKTVRLISQEGKSSATGALLAVEIAWTGVIFILYGLLAPSNRAAAVVLVLTAAAVASAIFLIAELSTPFSGIIRISSVPVERAMSEIGR
ncbi:MAG: hypothetical protein WA629_10930 [Candidatus Aquilonibacter sp.]